MRIARWREEPIIVLRCARRRDPSHNTSCLLLLPLPPCLLRPFSLLTIVHEESQGHRQHHDDQSIYVVTVAIVRVVRCVSSRHGVVVDIVVQTVVIEQVVLDEVVDPFAEGPVFLVV